MAKEGFYFEIEIDPMDTSAGVSVYDFPEWEDLFNPFSMIDSDTKMTCAGIEIFAEKAEEDDDDVEIICWDRMIKRQGRVIRRVRPFHSIAASRGTGQMMDFDQATKGMNALIHQMWAYCQTNQPYVARFYCVADLRAPGFITAALDEYFGRNNNNREEN